MRLPLIAASLAAFGVPVTAQTFVPEGQCALVVASRQSVSDVRTYVREHSNISYRAAFRAENGWHAIVHDFVPREQGEQTISTRVADGSIPPDSYCSDGSTYLEKSWVPPQIAASESTSVEPAAAFDARPLSKNDKRYLQGALALEGYYKGFLDGVWGNGTQAAFERMAQGEYGLADNNQAIANIIQDFEAARSQVGWHYRQLPDYDISLMLPTGRIQQADRGPNYIEFTNFADTMTVLVMLTTAAGAGDLHAMAMSEHTDFEEPYTLRSDDRWVSSISTNQVGNYLRSDWSSELGGWVSISIVFHQSMQPDPVNLITSSIAQGSIGGLEFNDYGHLGRILDRHGGSSPASAAPAPSASSENETPYSADGATVPEVSVNPEALPTPAPGSGIVAPEVQPPAPDRDNESPEWVGYPESSSFARTISTGSGFYITSDGLVMTNAHVVESCPNLSIEGHDARVIDISSQADLALVDTRRRRDEDEFLKFSESKASLNADITVAGFPFSQTLGGLNITRGSISSMNGMVGDMTTMQISAPVQPGSSGGPAVDRYGNLAGVVVARLNDEAFYETEGVIPQNVNFAVKGHLAEIFAKGNNVDVQTGTNSSVMLPEDLAQRLQDSTVLIRCQSD